MRRSPWDITVSPTALEGSVSNPFTYDSAPSNSFLTSTGNSDQQLRVRSLLGSETSRTLRLVFDAVLTSLELGDETQLVVDTTFPGDASNETFSGPGV